MTVFTLCDDPHSVCGVRFSLNLNKSFLTYHFVSHWILSVMRHQEPELHLVLKPNTIGFGWVWVPARGFKSQSEVSSFKNTSVSDSVGLRWAEEFNFLRISQVVPMLLGTTDLELDGPEWHREEPILTPSWMCFFNFKLCFSLFLLQ